MDQNESGQGSLIIFFYLPSQNLFFPFFLSKKSSSHCAVDEDDVAFVGKAKTDEAQADLRRLRDAGTFGD